MEKICALAASALADANPTLWASSQDPNTAVALMDRTLMGPAMTDIAEETAILIGLYRQAEPVAVRRASFLVLGEIMEESFHGAFCDANSF